MRNRGGGTYDRSSSVFFGQGYRHRPQPLPDRSREAAGGRRRVRWSGRVSLRRYARARYSGGRFDAVVAHTLVSHVPEALTVLKEAGRVVKPGELIAVFDGDYASMTFALDDPAQSKKYDEASVNALVTSPQVMRQMPRLIQQAGLEMIRMFPYIMVEVRKGDFWLSGIDTYEKLRTEVGGDNRGRSHQLGQCTAQSLHQRRVFRRERLLHLYCTTIRVALSNNNTRGQGLKYPQSHVPMRLAARGFREEPFSAAR